MFQDSSGIQSHDSSFRAVKTHAVVRAVADMDTHVHIDGVRLRL
jgi:hypothetical protein